jgi:hypothetical protein
MAVLGNAEPYPNAVQAANITCAGILSHESAMNDGKKMPLPDWTFMPGSKPVVITLDEDTEPPWRGVPAAYSHDLGNPAAGPRDSRQPA